MTAKFNDSMLADEHAPPFTVVDSQGQRAFRLHPDQPEFLIRVDGTMTILYVDGQPMGILQSLEFKADAGELIPKAKVRMINYSEDTKERIAFMRRIPWLEVEEVPESEWSKASKKE